MEKTKSLVRRTLKAAAPVLSVVLFAAAVWVLHRELRTYSLHAVREAFGEVSLFRLAAACLLTAASYIVMGGYDILALRYVHHPLAYRKTGLASFVGYAMSNNIGLSLLSGGSVRYRMYSAWGLGTEEITKIVAFCSLSFWVGFLALGGGVFSVFPDGVSSAAHIPMGSQRILGIVMLCAVAGYAGLSLFRKTPVTVRGWRFEPISPSFVAFQIGIAVLDLLFAASVLYVLIGAFEQVAFTRFLAFYLMAMVLGVASQVPGGMGVFETVLLLMLSPFHPVPHVFAALLAYRGIYYWMPLIAATAVLGRQEYVRHRAIARRMETFIGRWVSPVMPQVIGVAVMIGGAILLFSGATPAVEGRMRILRQFVPLPLVEMSHFLGSLAGMGLVLLGRGLQRRLDAAWVLTLFLLVLGAAASLFKGLDFEEAVILAIIAGAMLPARSQFYRKASLFSERLNGGWIAAILVVAGASVWLGFFAYRHVDYSHELWWQFSFTGDAPRFMRATIGALGLAMIFAFARLLRPAPPPPLQAAGEVPDAVAAIVGGSIDASANLAFLGDKQFLFNGDRSAFIMYGVEGETWVAMGDPVGPETEWTELIWAFRKEARRFGDRAVFYEVSHRHLHLYLDAGLTLLKMGEEARVPLADFSLAESRRKDLRYIHRKLGKLGCSFDVLPPEAVDAELGRLKEISDAWLQEKNTREKSFSLGAFIPDYLRRFPVALVRHEGRIVAFANIWRSGGREMLSVDLMRYSADAPRGVMEYLFVEMMLWGRQQGYRFFSLGMAPLAGMQGADDAPLWHRLARLVATFGAHFYNFQGLYHYKQKFDPDWEPKYLACPGGLALPRILTDIGALMSGGVRGILMK